MTENQSTSNQGKDIEAKVSEDLTIWFNPTDSDTRIIQSSGSDGRKEFKKSDIGEINQDTNKYFSIVISGEKVTFSGPWGEEYIFPDYEPNLDYSLDEFNQLIDELDCNFVGLLFIDGKNEDGTNRYMLTTPIFWLPPKRTLLFDIGTKSVNDFIKSYISKTVVKLDEKRLNKIKEWFGEEFMLPAIKDNASRIDGLDPDSCEFFISRLNTIKEKADTTTQLMEQRLILSKNINRLCGELAAACHAYLKHASISYKSHAEHSDKQLNS